MQKTQESKKAKETKEEKKLCPENRLKDKFAAARVKIFVVTRISGNKSNLFWSDFVRNMFRNVKRISTKCIFGFSIR